MRLRCIVTLSFNFVTLGSSLEAGRFTVVSGHCKVNVDDDDARFVKGLDFRRLVEGIGALELMNSSSSASITSLRRLVLFE